MTDSIERQRFTKFTESFRWGYFELEPILGGVTRTCMFNDWDAPDELARFDVILKSDMEDRYWQCIEIQEKQRTTHAVKTVVRARLILPRHGRSTLEAREDWKEILLKAFDHQMNWAKNDGFRVRWDVDYVLKAMAKLGPAGEDPVLEKPAWTELLGYAIKIDGSPDEATFSLGRLPEYGSPETQLPVVLVTYTAHIANWKELSWPDIAEELRNTIESMIGRSL